MDVILSNSGWFKETELISAYKKISKWIFQQTIFCINSIHICFVEKFHVRKFGEIELEKIVNVDSVSCSDISGNQNETFLAAFFDSVEKSSDDHSRVTELNK